MGSSKLGSLLGFFYFFEKGAVLYRGPKNGPPI